MTMGTTVSQDAFKLFPGHGMLGTRRASSENSQGIALDALYYKKEGTNHKIIARQIFSIDESFLCVIHDVVGSDYTSD